MDLPVTPTGWANLFAHGWALLAYLMAALAGARALRCAYRRHDETPAFPLCLILDTTRWLFGRQRSAAGWHARDFLALGVFGTAVGCLFGALATLDFLTGYDWRKLGYAQGLQQGVTHGITGSALIILHCGIALLFPATKKGE
jgi:hypothetical protein